MQIAVLDYDLRDVDIITVEDSFIVENYKGSVEEFLISHCGYNIDNISYMYGEELGVNCNMTKESFGG